MQCCYYRDEFRPQNMTLRVIGRVRFKRNYGKMYCRHLFPYGGLLELNIAEALQNGPLGVRRKWLL